MIWLRVADVRGELLKRGVSVSKWANPWKLMKLLDKKLEEEVEKVMVVELLLWQRPPQMRTSARSRTRRASSGRRRTSGASGTDAGGGPRKEEGRKGRLLLQQ